MRWLTLSSTVLVLLLPSTGLAQRARAAEERRAAAWVAAREHATRAGAADLVEVPLIIPSPNCGCYTPGPYIGTVLVWAEIELAPGVTLPEPSTSGDEVVAIVRGYFTGNTYHAPPESHLAPLAGYEMHPFVVTEVVDPDAPRHIDHVLVVRRAGVVSCTSAVRDLTPLRIRQRRGVTSPVVAELVDGTRVTIARMRGNWVEITAPVAGWAHRDHVYTTCTP